MELTIEQRLERVERLLFLLLAACRNEVLTSPCLDEQDRMIIANYYDSNRGKGW